MSFNMHPLGLPTDIAPVIPSPGTFPDPETAATQLGVQVLLSAVLREGNLTNEGPGELSHFVGLLRKSVRYSVLLDATKT